jgi:hypothetical protein
MPRRQVWVASRADNVPSGQATVITPRHERPPGVIRLNERVRHNGTGDDEPIGPLPGGGNEWPLPPDGSEPTSDIDPDDIDPDGLEPGDVWDSGGPGSAAAAAQGCLCPMLPNDPRAGLGVLIAPDCPVHRSRLE